MADSRKLERVLVSLRKTSHRKPSWVAPLAIGAGAWWMWRQLRTRRASLAGQVALIAGGSRGLGFLIARELAREGCRLFICARDADELERARQSLRSEGAQVLALACDVTNAEQAQRLVAATIADLGGIDILVNCVGVIEVAPLASLTLAGFHQAMGANFWGVVHTSLAVLPHMRGRGNGRIVNITSIGGQVAVPHLLPYDAAKHAAVGFSEGLGAELASDGVSVTTVVPGLMRTGSHRFARVGGQKEREYQWFRLAASTPGLAMSAPRAARRIVAAAKRRDREVVLGVPAKALRLAKELFPELTLRVLAMANRLLPTAPERGSADSVASHGVAALPSGP
jgi:short-subunit dehydrogenase